MGEGGWGRPCPCSRLWGGRGGGGEEGREGGRTYLIPQLGLVTHDVVLVQHDEEAALGALVHELIKHLPGGQVLQGGKEGGREGGG